MQPSAALPGLFPFQSCMCSSKSLCRVSSSWPTFRFLQRIMTRTYWACHQCSFFFPDISFLPFQFFPVSYGKSFRGGYEGVAWIRALFFSPVYFSEPNAYGLSLSFSGAVLHELSWVPIKDVKAEWSLRHRRVCNIVATNRWSLSFNMTTPSCPLRAVIKQLWVGRGGPQHLRDEAEH